MLEAKRLRGGGCNLNESDQFISVFRHVNDLEKKFDVQELVTDSCFKYVGILKGFPNKFERTSFIPRNPFAVSNCLSIGGGEVDGLNSYLKYRRWGGGSNDSHLYLMKYK